MTLKYRDGEKKRSLIKEKIYKENQVIVFLKKINFSKILFIISLAQIISTNIIANEIGNWFKEEYTSY